MAGRPPKLSATLVRAARNEHAQATREGRRPRMKPFYVGLGIGRAALHLACTGKTYRWVE